MLLAKTLMTLTVLRTNLRMLLTFSFKSSSEEIKRLKFLLHGVSYDIFFLGF